MLRRVFVGMIVLGLAAPPTAANAAAPPSEEPLPPVQRPRQIDPQPAPTSAPAESPKPPNDVAPKEPTPPAATPETSPAPPVIPSPPPVQRLTPPPPESMDVVVAESEPEPAPEPSILTLPTYDDEQSLRSYDAKEQAERAAMTRRLVGARTLMAIGGVSLATGLMMVVGASIEASKRECDFEDACEDPPRRDLVRGLAAGGGVLTALGAVGVGFSVPMAKRARLELDASRRQASVSLHMRF